MVGMINEGENGKGVNRSPLGVILKTLYPHTPGGTGENKELQSKNQFPG